MSKSIRDNWNLVHNEKNEMRWVNKTKPRMWSGVMREPNVVVVTQRIANPDWQVLITSSEMLNKGDFYTLVGDKSFVGGSVFEPLINLFPNYKSKESAVRRARALMQKYPKGLEADILPRLKSWAFCCYDRKKIVKVKK